MLMAWQITAPGTGSSRMLAGIANGCVIYGLETNVNPTTGTQNINRWSYTAMSRMKATGGRKPAGFFTREWSS